MSVPATSNLLAAAIIVHVPRVYRLVSMEAKIGQARKQRDYSATFTQHRRISATLQA